MFKIKILISILIICLGIKEYNCEQDEKKYMSLLLSKVIGYRLPNDTIPQSYAIQIEPHFDEIDFAYNGSISIVFEVVIPTYDVTLHSSQSLEIDKSSTKLLFNNGKELKPKSQKWNPILEFFNIHFDRELETGRYTLRLKWERHGDDENYRGFYRAFNNDEPEGQQVMIATHFQPTAARKAFPCWDEPGLKAEFEISIKHSLNHTAVSNMPIRTRVDAEQGQIWSHFERSPVMSTYQVTLIVAPYVNIPEDCAGFDHCNFTFWANKENKDKVLLALEMAEGIVNVMENYTDMPYPLPKLDQIIVPQYSSSATEHWGIITYWTPLIAIERDQENIVFVDQMMSLVSHEVVHQWFGNIITPKWWGDLWLSEAFAVYFSAKAIDMMVANCSSIDLFAVSIVNRISFHVDEQYDPPHPVKWEPSSPQEIRQMFTGITYRKGAAILFMLENIVTEDVFQEALRVYLNDYKYGVVTTDDFWQALQDAYEDKGMHPHLNIKEMMDPWIEQTGYPLLNVTRDYRFGLTYVSQMDAVNPDSGNRWMIPITFTSGLNPDFSSARPTHWMHQNSDNLTLYGIDKEDWVILNIQKTGFYRINYDYENWRRIALYLNSDNYYKIHPRNRAQLIFDLGEFASKDPYYYELLLDFIPYLHKEINVLPWIPAIDIMLKFKGKIINTPMYDSYEKISIYLLDNLVRHVGFNESRNDTHLTLVARETIIPWACYFGHKICRTSAKEKLSEIIRNPNISDTFYEKKMMVYCTGLMDSNDTVWDDLMDAYFANPLVYPGYELLGCTENRHILKKYLLLAIDENASFLDNPVPDAFRTILEGRRENVDMALDFYVNHIEQLREYFEARNASDQLDYITHMITHNIKNPDQYDKFYGFLSRQEEKGKMKNTDQILATARSVMDSSQEFSKMFHAMVDKKPALFDIIHGPLYTEEKHIFGEN